METNMSNVRTFAIGVLLKVEIGLPFVFTGGADHAPILYLIAICALVNQITEAKYLEAHTEKRRIYVLVAMTAVTALAYLSVLAVFGAPYSFEHNASTKVDYDKIVALLCINLWIVAFILFFRILIHFGGQLFGRENSRSL